MSKNHGKFVWYELMTTDTAGATAFYRKLVGWDAKDSGFTDRSYTLLLAGGTMVGGLMELPEEARKMGARPGWMGYIAVDDVDRTADRVKAAGGKIHHGPENIPTIGRFAVAADPHGAIFVLFKGEGEEMPDAAPMDTPGHIGWRELHAGNLESAWAFYAELFGWSKKDAMDMGPMGVYQLFATGGNDAVGGMMTKTPDVPAPFWLYYFNVDAVDAAVERIKQAGGRILLEPHEVPGGSWIVQGMDPQGAMFAVVATKR